ncbi:hypothetical protein pb186bvf_004216 [Paramecium bursaria]
MLNRPQNLNENLDQSPSQQFEIDQEGQQFEEQVLGDKLKKKVKIQQQEQVEEACQRCEQALNEQHSNKCQGPTP